MSLRSKNIPERDNQIIPYDQSEYCNLLFGSASIILGWVLLMLYSIFSLDKPWEASFWNVCVSTFNNRLIELLFLLSTDYVGFELSCCSSSSSSSSS